MTYYGIIGNSQAQPPIVNGMDWTWTVTLPTGFTGGSAGIAQLINMARDDYFKQGSPSHNINQFHAQEGLDVGFPYFNYASSVGELGHIGDNPSQGYNNSMSKSKANDSFATWLMFQPSDAGEGVAWVPLKTHNWSWTAEVNWNSSINDFDFSPGSVFSPGANPSNPTDTTEHPTWLFVHPSPEPMVAAPAT